MNHTVITEEIHNTNSSSLFDNDGTNDTHIATCKGTGQPCRSGLIIPVWLPVFVEDNLTKTYRAILYGSALCYILFGISIVTDRIVASAEVISAHKRPVLVTSRRYGTSKIVKKKFWHPVVSMLIFVVPGTSSPEILLTFIDTFNSNFQLNAVCLLTAKESSGKPIKDLNLFFITSAFAIFAYLWVYIVLEHISPDIIELWEALVTLLLFPIMILCAWAVAARIPQTYIQKIATALRRNRSVVSPTLSMTSTSSSIISQEDEVLLEERKRRKKVASRLRYFQKRFPGKTEAELEAMVQLELAQEQPKSSAFYRLKATMALTGIKETKLSNLRDVVEEQRKRVAAQSAVQTVGFKMNCKSCLESCGSVSIPVERFGAAVMEKSLSVEYETEAATAKAGKNFISIERGLLLLEPGQAKAEISVTILDDGVYEERAKYFYSGFKNAQLMSSRTLMVPSTSKSVPSDSPHPFSSLDNVTIKFAISEIKISILDDDHCGVFAFENPNLALADNCGKAKIRIVRSIGTKCRVSIPYRITPGTAKQNEDYIVTAAEGVLLFEEGQFENFIEIEIIDKHRFGDVFNFHIELFTPRKAADSTDSFLFGGAKSPSLALPKLGIPCLVQVGICENEEQKEALDRLLKTPEIPRHVVSSTWKDQIRNVFTIDREDVPSRMVGRRYYYVLIRLYFIHIISFPWKLIVAILPPARLKHGYLAYASLLALMALLATLIGDLASLFACTVGLKETVTAITLLPLGTGLPDTFAAHYAAKNERTADAAIGGIMGSNAIGIFFAIGLSWDDLCVIRGGSWHST